MVNARLTALSVGNLGSLPRFDLRNGVLADVKPLFIRGTIPAEFHWIDIPGMDTDFAVDFTSEYIRAHYFNYMLVHPTAPTADARNMAIALGAARAGMVQYYKISTADLSASETAPAVLRWNAGGFVETVDAITAAQVKIMNDMADLSADEAKMLPELTAAGVGAVPVQGYSLVKTGHHYLSDARSASFRAFHAMERQLFTREPHKTWFEADRDTMRSVLWHKAGHPISIDIKTTTARAKEIREMLVAANIASAGVRLPVTDEAVDRAETHITLLRVIKTMVSAYGCACEFEVLEELVDAAKACEIGGALPNGYVLGPELSKAGQLGGKREILALLQKLMDNYASDFAWAYGYYTAMLEQEESLTTTTGGSDTLKSAYSLLRYKGSHQAPYWAGRECYKDYRSYRAQERVAGRLVYQHIRLVLN